MTTKHTAGKLTIDMPDGPASNRIEIINPAGAVMLVIRNASEQEKADMRRLVECWNKCEDEVPKCQ